MDPLIEALLSYRQADQEGVMVLVSRQACDEAAREIERLRAEVAALRKRSGDGSMAEPAGCPTPGACSCPGDEFVHPFDVNEQGVWCSVCGDLIAAPWNVTDTYVPPDNCRRCGWPNEF